MLRALIFISIVFLFSNQKIDNLSDSSNKDVIKAKETKNVYRYRFFNLEIYDSLIERIDSIIKEEKNKDFLVVLDRDLLPKLLR